MQVGSAILVPSPITFFTLADVQYYKIGFHLDVTYIVVTLIR